MSFSSNVFVVFYMGVVAITFSTKCLSCSFDTSSKANIFTNDLRPLQIDTALLPAHHLNYKSTTEEKFCRLRDLLFPVEIWNKLAGYYCYIYTTDYRIKLRYAIGSGSWPVNSLNWTVPVGINNEAISFYFDYTDSTSMEILKPSFRTDDYFQLWKSCAIQAEDCCLHFMTNENIEGLCPVTWDGWSCFPPGKNGTTSKLKCPDQAYSSTADVCTLESEKYCSSEGWIADTDYTVCSLAPVFRSRHNYHVIFLLVAIGLSLPAVIIFFAFRKFRRSLRLVLHRNLILIIIIRNIFTVMTKEIIILDALKSNGSNHVMDNNTVACRVLAFFEGMAKNGIYTSMLADGFYLHKMIVRAFADEPNVRVLYGIIIALTVTPSIIWAILRGISDNEDCWMTDTHGSQWVPDGFRIAVLAMNTLFLLDIIRVMVTKLKHETPSKQARATFRATLFLIPLFGLHIIILADRDIISDNSCSAQDVYFYLSYSLEALQGIMVAVLFCYINSEVHRELVNAWRKFLLHLEQRYGWSIGREKAQPRRTTAATYVEAGRPSRVIPRPEFMYDDPKSGTRGGKKNETDL